MKSSSYLNLKRIEFVITYHCTGQCMHCSLGDQLNRPNGAHCVNASKAADAVRWLAGHFPVSSVMTFGGEPLLYPDVVCKIHRAALESGVEKRQLITNGFFSNNEKKIEETAEALKNAGVNNLLLSVDAFHQKTIPMEPVRKFAEAVKAFRIERFGLQPAWLVNKEHQNPYNAETRKLLETFRDLNIPVNEGNDIFMAGNAAKYLAEYYELPELDLTVPCGAMPYTEKLDEITSLSIEPNGDVVACAFVIGNIYEESIEEIVGRYDPYSDEAMRAVVTGNVLALKQLAETKGLSADCSGCYTACDVCRKISRMMH